MMKRYWWLVLLIAGQLLFIAFFVMLSLDNMLTLKYEVETAISNTATLRKLYQMLDNYTWLFIALIALLLFQNIWLFRLLRKQTYNA
ncbi:MAG: hypothetical protein U0T75_13560 [Chitinophagales bacterium]